MKVSYATELMSKTSANYMDNLIKMVVGGLPPEASVTVEFVLDLDCTFDSLNGKLSRQKPDKPLRGPVTENSAHWEFWEYILPKLKTWRWIQRTTGRKISTQTPKNMIWTINAYKEAWTTLKSKAGFQEFHVGEASQDCLESIFGQTKFYASNYRTPTTDQFVAGKLSRVI